MVSKIAVIALVVIVAAPILIGYGLNFETETVTNYKTNNDITDVTPLLKDSTQYQYTTADPYAMNAQVFARNQYPIYQSFGVSNTSLYMKQFVYESGDTPAPFDPRDIEWYHMEYSNSNLNIVITGTGGNLVPISSVTDVYYLRDGDALRVTHNGGQVNTYNGVIYVSYSNAVSGGYAIVHYTLRAWATYEDVSNATAFVNLIGGYKFNQGIQYNLPSLTNKMVMSLDLYGGENGAFGLTFGSPAQLGVNFTKYADYWRISVNNGSGPLTPIFDLPIYASNDSVYQMTVSNTELRFDYVGKWFMPSFGIANSYRTYSYAINIDDFSAIDYHPENAITISPTLRMDVVMVRTMDYTAIDDELYKPVTIKPTNPATTINNITRYGSSISWGGHTYTVSNKSLTLGTHSIGLDGIVFDSIPNGANYDNRINGTVVSTTPAPSDITFNGVWLMNVQTYSLSPVSSQETKWVAGGFAWNGMDDDFLMVGALVSFAAFVILGIYGRRSGNRVFPLMLVCGGAGLMFLVMI